MAAAPRPHSPLERDPLRRGCHRAARADARSGPVAPRARVRGHTCLTGPLSLLKTVRCLGRSASSHRALIDTRLPHARGHQVLSAPPYGSDPIQAKSSPSADEPDTSRGSLRSKAPQWSGALHSFPLLPQVPFGFQACRRHGSDEDGREEPRRREFSGHFSHASLVPPTLGVGTPAPAELSGGNFRDTDHRRVGARQPQRQASSYASGSNPWLLLGPLPYGGSRGGIMPREAKHSADRAHRAGAMRLVQVVYERLASRALGRIGMPEAGCVARRVERLQSDAVTGFHVAAGATPL